MRLGLMARSGGVAQPPAKKCKQMPDIPEHGFAHLTTEEAQPSAAADLALTVLIEYDSTAVLEISLKWRGDPKLWKGTSKLRGEKLLDMPILQEMARQ